MAAFQLVFRSLHCMLLAFAFCNASNEQRSGGLQKRVDQFCRGVATPCKNVVSKRKLVSFLSWYSKKNVKLGDHETVKYDKVIENIGNGYSPSTGKFTAPVTGIYSISVSMMSEKNNSMQLDIMKNNQRLAMLYSHSSTYPQASSTLHLSLKRGDTVWVDRHSGRVLYAHSGGPFNVFSGALITQI